MDAAAFPPPLALPPDLIKGFETIISRPTSQVRERDRSLLILELGERNPSQASQLLKCSREKAYLWYNRAQELLVSLRDEESRPEGSALERVLHGFLKDNFRPGAPLTYTPEQRCEIIAMAVRKPREFDVQADEWTHWELAMAANRQGVTNNISPRTVGRVLSEIDLKPHRSKYWEFPNIEDEVAFTDKINEICQIYRDALRHSEEGRRTVSVDEKTGIQALERRSPGTSSIPGKIAKVEFEYIRHGTQALIPSFDVATGKIIAKRIGDTRTEGDFAELIEETIDLDPGSEWVFIVDQLNTHKSESLVRLVAKKINYKASLGVKEKTGILENMESRENFLSDASHKIRFVYTPKHCSWLNQIEIWFGIMTRKILRRGSFGSLKELRRRIMQFIDYYNTTMAKPFKWTYKGKLLKA